jgi:hypothetical protein
MPQPEGRQTFFVENKVTAQVWRSHSRKASGEDSGSFLKERTKKL